MNDNFEDALEAIEEEYEFLDTVEYENETYFMLIPASESDDIDGEVFIMKLVEINGEEMLEGVDDSEIFDAVYNIFKEKNKDEFEFLD